MCVGLDTHKDNRCIGAQNKWVGTYLLVTRRKQQRASTMEKREKGGRILEHFVTK